MPEIQVIFNEGAGIMVRDKGPPDDRHVLAAAIKAVPVTIARAGLRSQAVEREWGRRE